VDRVFYAGPARIEVKAKNSSRVLHMGLTHMKVR
jgi:hypothetical protein